MAAGPISTDMRWTATAADREVIEYDDTFLVYFRPSGETHFLNFLSHGVMDAVTDKELELSAIRDALRAKFGLSPEELPESLLAQTIDELDDTGMIIPAVRSAEPDE